jgi:hypothetical protein
LLTKQLDDATVLRAAAAYEAAAPWKDQVAAYARANGVIVELHQAAARESPRHGKFNGNNAIGSSAFIAPVLEFVSAAATGIRRPVALPRVGEVI